MVRGKDDKKKITLKKQKFFFMIILNCFMYLMALYLLTYFFCYEQEKCLKVKTHFLKLFNPT